MPVAAADHMANPSIFRLVKMARRIPRRLRGLDFRLRQPALSVAARNTLLARKGSLQDQLAGLGLLMAQRNIGGPTRRCALPLRIQRQLGLLPKLS